MESAQASMKYKVRGTKVFSPYPVQLTPAEIRLVFSLQRYFAPEQIFPDCYFPKVDDYLIRKRMETVVDSAKLLQIDCLAVNRAGIFVFESKDYGGWIYGNAKYREWTQTLDFGHEKHQFYNPVRQNATHVETIRDLFEDEWPIYSVVVFGRDTVLKVLEDVPDDTRVCTQANLGVVLTQMSQDEVLSDAQVELICEQIERSRLNPTAVVRNEHASEVRTAEEYRKNRH